MLTNGQLISLMEHACNLNVRPEHDLWATLNQAGRTLVNYASWQWLTTGPVDVPSRSGEREIALPADFGALVEVIAKLGPVSTIRQVSPVEFLRITQVASGVGASYALSIQNKAPRTGGPTRPVALIHPLPTADGTPTLTMVYLRTWVDVQKETDADKPIQVDAQFERALQLIAQAMAVATEMDDDAPQSYAADARAELKRLSDAEAGVQSYRGQLRGGLAEDLLRGRSDRVVFDGLIQVAAP